MTNILEAAGVPAEVLRLIADIIDTCRACRAYRRPPDHSIATSRLVTSFNELVQHDLLFVTGAGSSKALKEKTDPWQHVLDTCTRLTQAKIVTNRTTTSLVEGLSQIWIRP